MLFDDFSFGSFGGRREILKTREYLIYGGLGLIFILLVVLYVFEFRVFDRTLEVKTLVIRSLLFGILPGAWLGYLFRRSGKDLTEKVQIYVFFILMSVLFMPLFGSLTNRMLSFRPVRTVQVELEGETPFYASRFGVIKGEKIEPTGFYTFFYYNGHLERLKSKQALFPGKERGDQVDLDLRKGLWGYDLVVPGKEQD